MGAYTGDGTDPAVKIRTYDWRKWSDDQIQEWIADNESSQNPDVIGVVDKMEKELSLRADYAEMYPHDEHVGLDMPEGYGS